MSPLRSDFRERYGPWALVCGASDGIGEAFAEQIAAAGVHVVLLARRAPKLEALAARLQASHGIETRVVAADLTASDLAASVDAATRDLEIGLLVYVAGSATRHAHFVDEPVGFWVDQLRMNCDGPVRLGHHFGKAMRARGRGGIIFLTSLACQSGAGRMSLYTATKAFDQVFAESLWWELAPEGVDVLCLMVGATDTPTAKEILDLDFAALFPDPSLVARPEDVAREGLENVSEGPIRVVGEALRSAFPHLSQAARAAAIEGGTASTAALDRWDDYRPVWDADSRKRVR